MLILGGGDGALLHELLKVFRTFYAKMFFVHIVIVQGGAQVRHHGRHRRGGHEVVQGAHEV